MHRVSLQATLSVTLSVAGCNDHRLAPDGSVPDDAPADTSTTPDAPVGMPPPPVLGAQLDRVGRPAISTLLIAVFAAPADQTAPKDAYNHAPDPATWKTTLLRTNVTIEAELQASLAAFDAIDTGAATGCGNALAYTVPINAISYRPGADLLADDQLYVDTSKQTCNIYLALEIERGSLGRFTHTECGGRTLAHDAIDVTYSVLASGIDGLDPLTGFGPKIHGSLSAHPDIKDTFPFLGPPRTP